MARRDEWWEQARHYLAEAEIASDPVMCEQYTTLARLCEDLAVANESPVAGDASIEFDVGYAEVPLPYLPGVPPTIH